MLTDLYHVSGDGTASNHVWKLYVTDVLDTKQGELLFVVINYFLTE